jgi:2-polyprenyl-6-methoxyphenol hydroxylase-like FAD-dependent oxidoreductase
MTILIAGAGIGGLAAALSLHQIGADVIVIEAVRRIEPLGVGINVLPHAIRELFDLGLEKDLVAAGVETAKLAYHSKRGQLIWEESRGRAAGYRWPQLSIHRGTLQTHLLEAARRRLGPDRIVNGAAIESWSEDADGITARVRRREDGSLREVRGTLLIGADGIHSAVRAKLYPDEGPPLWNGAILWRGVTPGAQFLDGRTMIMAGHERQKFVAYPIAPDGGEPLLNWVAELKYDPDHTWRREDWNRPGKLDEFLPAFASWKFAWLDVASVIRAAPSCYEYPMVDRDPLPRWSFGRVTLLGDAAHAMYPIGSNGASQAILDARVLARKIRDRGKTPDALAAYEAERRPATSAIVLANRRNGPEQVMQLVEERAPDGFGNVGEVLKRDELEGVATAYKRIAGFTVAELNARPGLLNKS